MPTFDYDLDPPDPQVVGLYEIDGGGLVVAEPESEQESAGCTCYECKPEVES